MTLASLGEIVWDSIPARVSVSIESQLTIHPDSAEWVAVLRYDVVGASLDAIHLKLPVAWAAERRASPRGERIPVDDRDARSFRFLDDHPGAADLGFPAVCAPVEPPPGF